MSRKTLKALVAACVGAALAPWASAQVINENFDSVGTGTLPSGWTTSGTGAGVPWATVNNQSFSFANSVFTNDVASVSSRFLTFPSFVAAGPVTLSLWHYFTTEDTYDGWTVEVSYNGGPYANIGLAAWTQGGYTDLISSGFDSPIGGQRAFSGPNAAWNNSIASIPAVSGQNISIRIHMACDRSLSSTGVWIDDVVVTTAPPPSPVGVPIATPTPTPQGANVELKLSVSPGGSGTLNDIQNPPELSGVRVDVSMVSGNSAPDWLYLIRNGVSSDWVNTLAVPSFITPAMYTLPFEINQVGASPGVGYGSFTLSVIIPPPENDSCATPIALTVDTPYTGSNATASSTGDGAASTCQASVKNGVWFSFTTGPDGAGTYALSTCNGAAHDTVLTVYNAGVTCAGIGTASNILTCNDDAGPGCTGTRASLTVSLAASSTYLIRLQTWSTGTSGDFTLELTAPTPIDACCNNTTGACTPIIVGSCPSGSSSTFQTTCQPTTCPVIATCCNNTTGVCTTIYGGSCPTSATQGFGTVCDPAACPVTVCCDDISGACSLVYVGFCSSGTTPGSGTTCSPGACPSSGACCSGTTCVQLLTVNSGACGGTFTADAACNPNFCLPNDTCGGAIAIDVGSQHSVPVPSDATTDNYDTCSLGTTTRYGVWYSFTTGVDPGVLNFSEVGSHDIIVQFYSGTCAALTPIFCTDAETNINVTLPGANTTYYILLGMWSDTTVPTSSYELVANSFTPVSGACCDGSFCFTGVTASSCPGSWLGANSTCEPRPTYYESSAAPIPDATNPGIGTLTRTLALPAIPSISALQITVDIKHDWVGDVRIRLTSPGGSTAVLMGRPATGPTCPADFAIANGNDLNGVYVFDDAAATGIVTAALANAVLPSGSYRAQDCDGTLITLATAFGTSAAAGNWTLEVTDRDEAITGTLNAWGMSVNNAPLVGPCDTGTPTTENCCRGTTCKVVSAGSCMGTVAGSASTVVTNCVGNTFAGCCFGDYDHNGTKDITDIFTFLNAWFSASTYADISGNGANTPDITDIFTFLNAWFGTCS